MNFDSSFITMSDVDKTASSVSMHMTTMNASATSSTSSRAEEMSRIMENPAENWKLLPDCYRVDKECILQVLKHAPVLPPKSDFERQFPQSLRFDPDVVLAFCRRSDFVELYHERHLFVPDVLTNCKPVMLEYVSKIRRQLQECSEELTDDRDIVMAAVSLDGLELQYASRRLQQDEQILILACSKDGRALEFCPPGETRDKLLHDRSFMMTVLKNNGGTLFKYLPSHLANHDRELLLAAICNGLNIRNVPTITNQQQQLFLQDSLFLIEAIQNKASVYLQLSISLQKRECIAKAAIVANDTDQNTQEQALRLAPQLAQDADVAMRIIQVSDLETMKRFLLEQQPQYLENKAIMLHALKRDPDLLTHCSATLRQDVDIVMAGIKEDSAVNVLRGLSLEWLIQHAEVPTQAVRVAPLRTLNYIRRNLIPPTLWSNHRDLQIAWIKRGQRVLEPFLHVLHDDREMALAVAEFAGHDFYMVGERLRSDQEFMKIAISKNGRVWSYGIGALLSNMELAVRAIAQHPLALIGYNSSIHPAVPQGDQLTREAVKHHVEMTLQLRETFLNQFLRGVIKKNENDNTCCLNMLDQGQETGQAFKMLIAQFLGIPMGEMLSIYRKCHRHLQSPSPPPLEIIQDGSRRHLVQHDDPDVIVQRLAEMDRLQRRQFIQRRRRGIMLRLQQLHHEQRQPNRNDNINNNQQQPQPPMRGGIMNMNELLLRGVDIWDEDEEEENDVVDFFQMLDDPAPMFGGGIDPEALPAAAAENGLRVGWGARRPPWRAGDMMGRRIMRERMLAGRFAVGPPPEPGVNVGAPPIPGERRPRAVVDENLGRDDGVEEGENQNGHQHLRPPRRPRVMMDWMMDDDVDDWIIDLEEDDLR